MTIEAFFERLQSDNARKKNTHKLNKPADDARIAKWLKKHPECGPLSPALIDFLKKTDGVTLLRDKFAVAGVGGRLRLLGLKELDTAAKVMFEDSADEYDDLPKHWIGLGWDDNRDWSPVLDTQTGRVRIASQMGDSESHEVHDSFEQFLDWVVESLLDPHQEELDAEQEGKKKSKLIKKPAPAELDVVHVFEQTNGRLLNLSLSADGCRAVTASFGAEYNDSQPNIERTLRLWDVSGRRQERAFDVPREALSVEVRQADGTFSSTQTLREIAVAGAAISPDGRTVAANILLHSHYTKEAVLVPGHPLTFYDADSGVVMHSHNLNVVTETVRYSPDGRYVLAAGGPYLNGGGDIHLFDSMTFAQLVTWEAHKPRTTTAAFFPDSKRIISAGWNKTLKIWEATTGKTLDELPRQRSPVVGLAISHNGQCLALGGFSDRVVRVMDLSSRQIVAEFRGHTGGVQAVSFSPHDKHLATNDGNAVIRVWDVASGNELARHQPAHLKNYVGEPPGTDIAFLPDGRHLVSCGWDRTLRLLRLPG